MNWIHVYAYGFPPLVAVVYVVLAVIIHRKVR